MAAFEQECDDLMDLSEMVSQLLHMSKPRFNDIRQNKNCDCINVFLSHFCEEKCMIVGSTNEETRLRTRHDGGDFDYLGLSEIVIPLECLEYNPKAPCFVNINASKIKEKFPKLQLIDDKYLPNYILKECRPEAFSLLRLVCKIVPKCNPGDDQPRDLYIGREIKPGISIVNYELEKMSRIISKLISRENLNKTINQFENILNRQFPTDKKNINILQIFISLWHELKSTQSDIEETKQEDKPSVLDWDIASILKYSIRSHKDFIFGFPISGKPAYLDEWCKRERLWPDPNTVGDIYNCDFFLVARQAILDPQPSIDFSLGYSLAEMILAKSMLPVQRSVVLIIKAYQRSILKSLKQDITNYHWKHAIYWVSEKYGPRVLQNPEENILAFLKLVLEFMTNCVCKQQLEHYFIPSNMFANMNPERAFNTFLPLLVEIQEDPADMLRQFFIQDRKGPIEDYVAQTSISENLKIFFDETEDVKEQCISEFLSILKHKGDECMNTAVLDTLINSLEFIRMEHVMKTQHKKDNNIPDQCVDSALDDIVNTVITMLDLLKTSSQKTTPLAQGSDNNVVNKMPIDFLKTKKKGDETTTKNSFSNDIEMDRLMSELKDRIVRSFQCLENKTEETTSKG